MNSINMKIEQQTFDQLIDMVLGKNTTGVLYDGPTNFGSWNQQNLKVVCLYKESYGYNLDEGTRVSDKYVQWLNAPKVKTYWKIGLLIYIVNRKLQDRTWKANVNDLKRLVRETQRLTLARELSKVALINLNKFSIPENATKDKFVAIRGKENAMLVRSQLTMLQPDIIICGGRVVCKTYVDEIDTTERDRYIYGEVERSAFGKVANFMHVSAPSCGYSRLIDYANKIVASI